MDEDNDHEWRQLHQSPTCAIWFRTAVGGGIELRSVNIKSGYAHEQKIELCQDAIEALKWELSGKLQ